MQPFESLALGQRGVAIVHGQLPGAQLFDGKVFLLGAAQQAVENVAVGRFFQVHAHRLGRAEGHEVRAVAEAELEVNLLGFGAGEEGHNGLRQRNAAPTRRPGRAHGRFGRRRGGQDVAEREQGPCHVALRANVESARVYLKRLHERCHELLEVAFLHLPGHHDEFLLQKRQQLLAVHFRAEGVEQVIQQQPRGLQTHQYRVFVLEIQLLTLVLNGGKVVRAFLVAAEVEQDGSLGGCQPDFLPGRLPIAAHDEHALACQPRQQPGHAGLHVLGNGLLHGLVALVGMVGFQKKLGRGNLPGPEFFHHGFLLNLVAKLDQLKIGGVEGGGKLVGILTRYGLVL